MEECPEENEHGVRSNPVCVDEVDTTQFMNLTDVDLGDLASITSTGDAIEVSRFALQVEPAKGKSLTGSNCTNPAANAVD